MIAACFGRFLGPAVMQFSLFAALFWTRAICNYVLAPSGHHKLAWCVCGCIFQLNKDQIAGRKENVAHQTGAPLQSWFALVDLIAGCLIFVQ